MSIKEAPVIWTLATIAFALFAAAGMLALARQTSLTEAQARLIDQAQRSGGQMVSQSGAAAGGLTGSSGSGSA